MQILEIRTFRGPNYWSGYWKKLIVMRLDIGDYEDRPTDSIDGFYERMVELMPIAQGPRLQLPGRGRIFAARRRRHVGRSCYRAFCSRAADACRNGHGLWPNARDKRTAASITSFSATWKKRSAVMPAVRPSSFFWISPRDKPIDEIRESIADDVQKMREIREEVRFGPSTGSLVEEAESRNIPFIRLNDQSLVQLGYGVYQKRIQATTTANTNMIAVDIAANKHATKKLLGDMGVPVPKGYRIRDIDELEKTLDSVGFPAVIKPLDGNHGKGATVGIKTLEAATDGI